MARVVLPESRVRARKRARRIRIIVVAAAAVVLFSALIIGFLYIPALRVHSVEHSGLQTVATSSIDKLVWEELSGSYFFVIPKNNIFTYPKDALRERLLEEFPTLSVVDVHAEDFSSIAVRVVERMPRALWCASTEECYFMDEKGVVYARAPRFSEHVYQTYRGTITGTSLPKQFLSPERFTTLAALADAITAKLTMMEAEYTEVDVVSDVRMHFTTRVAEGEGVGESFTLLYVLDDHAGDVFERLTLALAAEPFVSQPLSNFAYLDLRFGDKLYYKLRNGPESAPAEE